MTRTERIEGRGVAIDPNILGGAPCVAGTRIPVSAIRNFSEDGYTPEQIVEQYPSLTVADVAAALAWKANEGHSLRQLRERVAALDGPSREVDGEIWCVLFAPDAVVIDHDVQFPNYTASIDAALALCERVFPTGTWEFEKEHWHLGPKDAEEIEERKRPYRFVIWPEMKHYGQEHGPYYQEWATTLPLAILSALLSAYERSKPE